MGKGVRSRISRIPAAHCLPVPGPRADFHPGLEPLIFLNDGDWEGAATMTDEPCAAAPVEPKAEVEGRAAPVTDHLAIPLQEYFAVADQASLPEGLYRLVERFEAALGGLGARVADDFREDLVKALPVLRTFAMALCANATHADDLVQETMVRAWANRDRFIPGTNFAAWTFTILRNQFYTGVRKGWREVEDAEGTHAETLTAAPDQEHVVALGSVMDLIAGLPGPQREALLLVGAEGYTYEEAAVRLGCQVGTVKSRVSRARNSLVGALRRGASSLGPAKS